MADWKRVLVVDDEPDIRQGVSRWLQRDGIEPLFAEDGEIGVAAARAYAPDAILLDMLMPKLDGLQTLALLRADAETANIPVVMLSASLRDQQRALNAGAKFFVHKPYNGKHLLAAVNTAIDQAAMTLAESS